MRWSEPASGAEEFAAWYAAQAPRILAVLTTAVGDAGLAEEATAEAFARAFARWASVSRLDSPNGWVYVVALNHARDLTRRRRRERRYVDRGPARVVAPPEVDDALWNAVRALPERARVAVALRYVADLPEHEVARLMRVSRGTVATTLHRARASLAAALRDDCEVTP